MRKLTVLFATLAMVAGLATSASAASVTLTSGTMSLGLGALPAISISGNTPQSIFVSSGSGSFTLPSGVFGPATIQLPRSLFTGVPQISGLTLAGFGNGTQTVNAAAGTAVGGVAGKSVVNVLQLINLSIPLSPVGQPGASIQAGAGSIIITVFGQGWTTGTATVTAATSTTTGTAVLHTFTSAGSDNRTAAHGGSITLVSGFRAKTNVAGTLPGFAKQVLNFAGGGAVPEPGTLLLLGSGVAGLALLGRRRMRK